MAKNTTDTQASFVPNAINIPPLGAVSSTLHVSADLDAQAKPNTVPYEVNFTTIDPMHHLSSHNLSRQLTFPVTVLPQLTIPEYLEIGANWFTSLNSI